MILHNYCKPVNARGRPRASRRKPLGCMQLLGGLELKAETVLAADCDLDAGKCHREACIYTHALHAAGLVLTRSSVIIHRLICNGNSCSCTCKPDCFTISITAACMVNGTMAALQLMITIFLLLITHTHAQSKCKQLCSVLLCLTY